MIQSNEQSFQIELAGFLNLAALDPHIIHEQFFLPDQLIEIEPQRSHVSRKFFLRLLESNENSRLIELARPAHQEFRREQRLTATRTATNQRGPALRQAAPCNFIKAGYPCGCLRQFAQSP